MTEMFEPIVRALGCKLWGIEYNGQGKFSMLRVYIDKDGGIDVEDCAEVSRQVSAILDVEDPISGEYTLEVSSPGLERPLFTLEQFAQYIGSEVKIQLRIKFENRKNFGGVISGIEDDEVVLIEGEDKLILPFELIDKAKLVARF